MHRVNAAFIFLAIAVPSIGANAPDETAELRIPDSTHNLLLDAKTTGNLKSYRKGLRGKPDDVLWDPRARAFATRSSWHEYGVGFGQKLGVVSEAKPAYWQATWERPVRANLIALTGAYPNQPQPETAWKIELRRDGKWLAHARGKGGWYDHGRYVWGGASTESIEFDGLRVAVFSKDNRTPVESVHFRGEQGYSWIVAEVPPIAARIDIAPRRARVGASTRFRGEVLDGTIATWKWDFGDGTTASGREVDHGFRRPGKFEVTLEYSGGKHTARTRESVVVLSPVDARITPLSGPVLVGESTTLRSDGSLGKTVSTSWDFGDGERADGSSVSHAWKKPGIYRVKLTVSDGEYEDTGEAIVRVHTPRTVALPQVLLDTDQKNEVDDQHYLGYAVFSGLDILGVNSVHHGGGQEQVNYDEILHVLDLCRRSGLPPAREPTVYRGADERMAVPQSGRWQDTDPIVTAASDAILAAARGASPTNPVWVVPVGPGTNAASAVLQAREEGLDLEGRIRIFWLGGSNTELVNEFNGNNDPWSAYVLASCGIETWIIPAPVSGRLRMDKRVESSLYPKNPLGDYLKKITPAHSKSLYDPAALAAIIGWHEKLGWVKKSEPIEVQGPKQGYRWKTAEESANVRVIREIDQDAMKKDVFSTLGGSPRSLRGDS